MRSVSRVYENKNSNWVGMSGGSCAADTFSAAATCTQAPRARLLSLCLAFFSPPWEPRFLLLPGAWFFYSGIIVLAWLSIGAFVDAGTAWTMVNVGHAVATFYLFHWVKVGYCGIRCALGLRGYLPTRAQVLEPVRFRPIDPVMLLVPCRALLRVMTRANTTNRPSGNRSTTASR